MPISLVRIDDRLVHGQVVEGWIPYLGINEIAVISDRLVSDDMRKTLMRLSLPEEIDLKVMTVSAAVSYLKEAASGHKKVLVLAPSPMEVAGLIENGMRLDQVNVGGMHFSVGKIQIGRAIFLDDRDIQSLKTISAAGTKLEGRGVPTDSAVDIAAAIG